MPVYQNKSKKSHKWYFSCYATVEGERKKVKRTGFVTRTEALIAEDAFISALSTQPSLMTVRQLIDKYLANYETKVKPSTASAMRLTFAKHVANHFKEIPMDKVTRDMISFQWVPYLQSQDLAPHYKQFLHRRLYLLFNFAMEMYGLRSNPVSGVHLPKEYRVDKEDKKIKIWTLDQFKQFITTFAEKDPWGLFFKVLYYTGMRRGEIEALTFGDYDSNRHEFIVSKSLTNHSKSKKYEIYIPKTKNANRRVLVPEFIHEELIKYINAVQPSQRHFFFGVDKPFLPTTIERKKNEHCRLSGVDQIRIHDFRHSHASYLINLGADPLLVASRLGHSSPTITLSIYAHLFPSRQQALIDLFKK